MQIDMQAACNTTQSDTLTAPKLFPYLVKVKHAAGVVSQFLLGGREATRVKNVTVPCLLAVIKLVACKQVLQCTENCIYHYCRKDTWWRAALH